MPDPAHDFDRPLNLRPSRRPLLVRLALPVLLVGCAAVLFGAPVWLFMHGSASGWVEDRAVTAAVADDARCRTGPPPGKPTTCEATWGSTDGDVSNRYGGPSPEADEEVGARAVSDDLALTGFNPVLLAWARVSPHLTIAGVVLLAVVTAVLTRFDPRWWTRRTDLT
ncbi:hypothetical protein [Nocardioides lijunqiniae]|uniref:hypothetical protein n=1 Tax=Nocardioides lijunqiniae TaxID=2760832 RepID=UPI0018786DDC|nr:hypothetical protein [Nocardioides lijunqiniae]